MLDIDHDLVAVLQEPLGITEPAHARWRAGRDHVPGSSVNACDQKLALQEVNVPVGGLPLICHVGPEGKLDGFIGFHPVALLPGSIKAGLVELTA